MTTLAFEHFFKPEVRAAAEGMVADGAVYLKLGSDTQIDANVKATPVVKVAFRARAIADEEFTADCTCSASKKGQYCKHIWATLLVAIEKSPDFFDSKKTISKVDGFSIAAAAKASSPKSDSQRAAQAVTEQRQAEFKQKQSDYRKDAYQKQKVRAKEFKAARDGQASGKSKLSSFLPGDVQTALKYFEENGFPLAVPVDPGALGNAKRILSRVFHPDKGGTQAEILELLKHADVLLAHR
jgi:hypothetical protein